MIFGRKNNEEDIEINANRLRIGDVVSIEMTIALESHNTLLDNPQPLSDVQHKLIVGTVVNIDKKQKIMTIEDDKEITVGFKDADKIFRLF